MKQEIKKIVLVGIAGVLAFAGLFGVEETTITTTTTEAVDKTDSTADKPVINYTDKMIKKIEIMNASDYDVKLYFTEQEPGEGEIDQQSIKVEAGEVDTKRVEFFGDGKLITDIQYVVYFNKKKSAPMHVVLMGDKLATERKDPTLDHKVVFEGRRDFDADDKILKITIRNADAVDKSAEAKNLEEKMKKHKKQHQKQENKDNEAN